MRKLFSFILLMFLLAGFDASAKERGGGSTIPAQAFAAGYTLNTYTMNSNFTSATVDTGCTLASGFKVYNVNFNYTNCDYAGSGTVLEADGTAFVPHNSTMSSASRLTPGSPSSDPAANFVGTAFGGGGYFEATVLFDPTLVTGSNWPAWWLMSIEKLCNDYGDQWTGQADQYHHFQEVDIVEWFDPNITRYNATTIDWYGIFAVTCPGQYCELTSNAYSGSNTTYGSSTQASLVPVPKGTDFTLYHRYGVLWIPATVSTNGSYQFYFDDIPVGTTILHSQFTTQTPPPTTSTSWTFGVGDNLHFAWLLGDLRVKTINVWQATTVNNLTF